MDPAQDLPQFDPDQLGAAAATFSQRVQAGIDARKKVALAPAAKPPVQPNGVMTDIGHGLIGGAMVDLPKMIGQAGQALGLGGKEMEQNAEKRGEDPLYQTTGAWGAGARGVAPALAAMGLSAAAAPAGAAAAAIAGGAGASALFGLSTYTDVKDRALAAGATPEVAEDAGRKAGAVMGVGQAAAAAIGGKVLAGTVGNLADSVLRKASLENGFQSFVNPGLMKVFGKNFAEMMGVQLPVQAGTAAAMNEIENDTGVAGMKTGASNFEAAKASFAPTAAMTTLLSPLGYVGARQTIEHRRALADTVVGANRFTDEQMADPVVATQRERALQDMAKQLRRIAPREEVEQWQLEAARAIKDGLPVDLSNGFTYDFAKARMAEKRANFDAQGQGQLPLGEPGGQDFQLTPPEAQEPQLDQSGQGQLDFGQDPAQGQLDLSGEQRRRREGEKRANFDAQGQGQLDLGEPFALKPPEGTTGAGNRISESIDIHAPKEAPAAPEEIDYGHHALPGEAAPDVNSPEARRARIEQNRRTIAERGAANTYPDAGGIEVGDKSRRTFGRAADAQDARRNAIDVQEQGVEHIDVQDTVPNRLKDELPKVPTSVRDKLAAAKGDPKEEARIAREILAANEGGTQKYLVALDEFAKKRETTNEHANAEAAPAADQRTEPQRGAGAAKPEDTAGAEQVAPAQGNAEAGRAGAADEKAGGAGQGEAQVTNPIKAAVVRFGGKEYDGATHIEAIQKAIADGVPTRTTESGVKVPVRDEKKGDSINLFRTHDGKLITRDQAGELVGAKRTEEMPKLTPEDAAKFAAPELPEVWPQTRGAEMPGKQEPGGDVNYATTTTVREEGKQAGGGQAGDGTARRTEADVKAALSLKGRAKAESVLKRKVKEESERDLAEKAADAALKRLDTHRAETQAVKDRHTSLLFDQQHEPTKERAAQLKKLDQQIASRGFKEEELVKAHSDLVGKAEKFGNPEPALTSAYHDYTRPGSLTQFMADMLTAGADKPGWKEALAMRGAEARGAKATRAAVDALDKLTPDQKAHLSARAEHYARSLKTAKEMGAIARDAEDKVRRAIREDEMDEREFNARERQNRENLQNGLITPEQYEKNVVELLVDATDRNAIKNRGLAGLSDEQLAAKVPSGSRALDAMLHIGRTHHSPVMRAVATLIATHMPNAEIRVVEQPDFNGGRYDPRTHTIEIGRGGMNPITLVHETVHSLAHAALHRAMANIGRSVLSVKAVREVEALKTVRDVMAKFAKIADRNNDSHRLALQDEHEFLSESLGNPDMQALLDRKGWWGSLVDGVRGALGLDAKYKTDFQRLLEATPDLFGDPNRDMTEKFNRDIVDTVGTDDEGNYRNTPHGWLGRLMGANRSLDKLSDASTWDTKGALRRGMFRWTSYNNSMQWLERRAQNLITAHPEHADKINAFVEAFRLPKHVIETRSALSQHLMNGLQESSDVTRQMAKVAKTDPAAFNAMGEMARRGRQAGVDPRDQTFAAAKLRNKNITQEMFDSAAAKAARAEWQRLKGTEAGKLYERVRQHNELSFARHYATMLNNISVMHELPRDAGLDWWGHINKADGSAEDNPQVQINKLNTAIQRARAMATTNTTEGYREAVESLLGEYDRQRATPYVHLGRQGDYMVHFEVRPEFYDQVRKIVTADVTQPNGLGRDMGPMMGNRVVDMRFESPLQHKYAEKVLLQLEAQGAFHKVDENGQVMRDGAGKPINTWASGKIVERYKAIDGATPVFIKKLRERIRSNPALSDDMRDTMIREITDAHYAQLPESSPMKASMFADKAAGSSKDFLDTFAKRQTMANRALVSAYAGPQFGEAMRSMDKAMQAIKETPGLGEIAKELADYQGEVKGRITDMQQPVNTPGFDFMRAIAAPFRLALSPAYVAMVAYQPLQMTLPVLGGVHGFATTAGSMARNYGTAYSILNHMFKNAWDVNKDSNLWQRLADTANPVINFDLKNPDGTPALNKAQRELMDHLQWSGLINFGQMQQIWRPTNDAGMSTVTGKVGEANRIASAIPHYIEMSNRLVAALAAHELALTKGAKTAKERNAMMENATAEQKDAARKYAMQIIRNTDGDHSQGNIARALGRRGFAKGATPLVVGFNQYDFQMTESLVRLALGAVKGPEAAIARKQVAGIFAMTAVMAGALGMPFMGMMAALYNRIGSAVQNPEDTPPDFEKGVRDFIDGVFGEKAGEIVSRGIPRLLDVDMSSRSGYQDLAPFTDALKDRQKIGDTMKDQALNFLGPAVGVGVGMVNGARELYKGNYVGAINDGLPAFARNAAKAWRLSQYGFEREGDANAQIPIPASTWNVVAQAMGFGSGRKADITERQYQWNTNQQLMQERMAIIRDNWTRAMDHGDGEEVGKQMENIVRFATAQPQYANAPTGLAKGYRERMQEQAIAASAGGGVHVSKRQVPFLQNFQQGGFPSFGGGDE